MFVRSEVVPPDETCVMKCWWFDIRRIYPAGAMDTCVAVGTGDDHEIKSAFVRPVLQNCPSCQRCFARISSSECWVSFYLINYVCATWRFLFQSRPQKFREISEDYSVIVSREISGRQWCLWDVNTVYKIYEQSFFLHSWYVSYIECSKLSTSTS